MKCLLKHFSFIFNLNLILISSKIMRNFIKNSSLALAAVFALSACGSKTATPETAAIEFSQAIGSLDFTKAKALATPETQSLLDMLASMAAAATPEDKKKGAEEAKNLKSAKCTVDGEKAKCTVCCSPDGKESEQAIDLIKKDGKWLVSINKEESMKSLQTTPETAPETAPETTTEGETPTTEGGEVETNNAE